MEYNDITQSGYSNYNDLQDINDEYQGISQYLEDNPLKTSKRGITQKQRQQLVNRQEELRKQQNLMSYGYTPYKGGTDIGRFNPDYFDLEDQPYVTNMAQTETPFGESRYDKYAQSDYEIEHINDVRANNQSGFNKLMAGTAKAAVLAGTTWLDGTVGFVYGLSSATVGWAKGDSFTEGAAKIFDNELSNGLQDVNQKAEKILPNYRSELEDSRQWYQNMGTANFWADFLKQIGFTVGAYYSGASWTKALKAIKFIKSPIGARVAGSLLSGINEGRIEANQIQNEHYNRETELLDIAFNKEKDDVMRRYYNGQLSDEEANAILETLYNNNEIDKQKIKENSDLVGLIDLGINVPILTLDNMLMFGKAYSRGFNNANKAVNSRRTFGQWFRNLQGKASENLGVLENEIAQNVEKTAAGYGWNTITKGQAALKGVGHFLREGNEEMAQAYASEFASALYQPDSPDAYYQALYDPNALDNTKSFYQSAVQGFSNSYGNLDRWQEFVMGGLTGLLGTVTFGKSQNRSPITYLGKGKNIGITGGLLGEFSAANYYNQRGEANVKFMNDYVQRRQEDFEKKIRHFAMSDHYNTLMNGWAEESNKFEYENAKDNDDFEAFTRFNNAGRLQDFKDMINQDFADLSDEDLDLIAKSQDNNNQWRNPDGTYMSETPEGRAKMREKLEENRLSLLKSLEDFETIYEQIVNATNDDLTNEQNLELAWLKWKVNRFNDRFTNIKSQSNPFFQSLKQGLQEYVDAFDDSVDESKLSDEVKEDDPTRLSERQKYEFSKRIASNARELIKVIDYLDNSRDALEFQRRAGVNYKTLNQIIDEDTYNLFAGYTSMTYDQYHDTIQNLLDAAKLGIAANQFDERLQEYMNDPANIEKHHSKVRQKVDKAVDNVKSNRAAQEFNDKDVSEVANMIEGLELMETDDGDLVNSSNVNITKNMSKEEKDQAKQKFDEASKLKKTKDMVIAEIERDQDIAQQLDITPSDKQAAIQSLQMSFESGDMEVFMPDQTVELDVIMPQDGNDVQQLELLNNKRNVYINTILGVVHKRKQDAEKREEHTPDIDTEKESQNQDSKQENTTGNDSVDKTPPVQDNENNNTPQTEEQISTPEIDDSEINSQNESQKKSDDEQQNAPLSENQWKPGLSRYPLSRFRNSHPNINPQTPYYKLVKDNPSQYGYNEDSVEYRYVVNVGEYLEQVGAFENRYKGTLGKDGEIHFMISPTLNSKVGETIVLILDKDNNVIGNLPYLNAKGNSQELNDFIYDCIVKYQTQDNGDLGDYIITGKDSKPITSYIDQMYNGRIPIDYVKVGDQYVPQRHVINSIFGNSSDLIKFGITKESGDNIPVYTKKSKYADPNVRSAKRALKGQPFLLIKTASGQEVTVPIFMRRYSESTAVVDQESQIPTYFDREVRSLVSYVIENNNKKQFTTNIQQIVNDAFNSLFSSQDFRIWFDPNTKTITQITIGGNNPVRVESKKRTLYDVVRDGILTEQMLVDAIRNANMPINFDLNRINSVGQDDYIGGVKYNLAMAQMAEATLPIGVIHTIDDFFTFSPVVDGSAIKAPVQRFESKHESTKNIKILDDGVSKIDYVTWDYIDSSDKNEMTYDVNDDINAFIDNNDKQAQKRLLERAKLFLEKRLQPENGEVVIFLKFNTTHRQLQYDISQKQLVIPKNQQTQQQFQIDMAASPVLDGPVISVDLMGDNAGQQVSQNTQSQTQNPETGVKSSYNDVDMQDVETWFEDESPVGIIDYYHEVWGDLDETDKKKIYAIRNDFPDIGQILDEFNTDNHSDTLDALINGGQYRRVEETDKSENKVRDEEMEWFKQTYPQLSSQERLRIVDGLIEISNSDNPGYAWGKFSRGIIEISNVAASGTVYHEAFHAISHTLMTNNEFNRMLNIARKLHPEMTNLDLEEFMAEDFRGYMQIGISQHKDNFIQRIFKQLKNIIKGLFNKQYLLTNAYYRISQGLYSNRSIRQTNAVRDRVKTDYNDKQPSLQEFTQSTIKSIHDQINKIGPIKVGVTEVVELLTPKRKFRNPRTGNYDFFEDSRYFVNLATQFRAGYNPDSAFDTDGSENYYNRTQVMNEIENRISKLGLDGLVHIGRNEYGAYELMPNEEALRNVYDSAYGYKTKEIVRVGASELFDASGLSTVSDILDKVISLDSRIGFLASELRRKINKNNNIEVRLVTPEELQPYSKNGRIPDGLFVPGPEHLRTSEILINKNEYRPDIIVLHEIVHMFAFNSRKNASKLKQLQRIYEDAILQFEDKYGKSKEDLIYNGVEVTRKDGTKHTIKPFYGLTNIDEFLSEAFANPQFMNELATLEFGSDKKKSISLFDRFTNWVLGILGIDRTSDVFDRTVKFLNEMFTDQLDVSEENVYQYAQNYSQYQESYFASPQYEEDLVYDKHTKFEYDNLSDDRIEYLQKSNISRWLYDRLDDDSKEMLFDCAH